MSHRSIVYLCLVSQSCHPCSVTYTTIYDRMITTANHTTQDMAPNGVTQPAAIGRTRTKQWAWMSTLDSTCSGVDGS